MPTNAQGEHAISSQNGRELNLRPSRCEATALTTVPPEVPSYIKFKFKLLSKFNGWVGEGGLEKRGLL